MKKVGLLAASVAVAYSAAVALDSSRLWPSFLSTLPSNEESSSRKAAELGHGSRKGSEEKFTPRFDGLRFIETLVTAHR